MLTNTLYANKKLQEGKFIRQLKKYLNELVTPSPNLPDDYIFDEKTKQAILAFKNKSSAKGLITPSNFLKNMEGLPDIYTWATIGKALANMNKLKQEISNTKDPELRSLIIGVDDYTAIFKYYTAEMEACDSKIASILGGHNAVAASNGFEPEGLVIKDMEAGLNRVYYRGDHYKFDPRTTPINNNLANIGHLSRYIMHLYGSLDGTRLGVDGFTYTDIFIPDGFDLKKKPLVQIPTPTQAVVQFYYKRFGNVEDVTLLLMHVKDFKPIKIGNRWKIGQIGGTGGISTYQKLRPYIHSHFVLLKGDVGLAVKYDTKGKMDDNKTLEYRHSIGVNFKDALC